MSAAESNITMTVWISTIDQFIMFGWSILVWHFIIENSTALLLTIKILLSL